MRRLLMCVLLAGTALLGLTAQADAQPWAFPAMLKPIGFETITVSTAAKKLTGSEIAPADWRTKGKATLAFLSVETEDIRLCVDGTTATASNCHLIPADGSLLVYSTEGLTQLSMYGPSGAATVKVTYFREVGK